jgi:acetyl esterase
MFNFPVEERVYVKTEKYGDLRLFIFHPSIMNESKPAIIFFHGAGFSTNKVKPNQFQYHADHFSSLGFISICVEYRPSSIEGLFSPIESIKHARSAIRWIRSQSSVMGINPEKLVVAGASAGGYLGLCCAMIDEPDSSAGNIYVSCIPNALVVFNGGVDSEPLIPIFPELSNELSKASPINHVREGLPPSIFFHGTHDANIPHDTVQEFVTSLVLVGNESKLVSFEGMGHGFFNYGSHDNEPYRKTLAETERFMERYILPFW